MTIEAKVIADSISSQKTLPVRPCKRGHLGPRYKNGNCRQCLLDREAEKYTNPVYAELKKARERARGKKKNAQRTAALAEIRAERKQLRAAKTKQRRAETAKIYREKHGEKLRAANREFSRLHFQKYKHRYVERNARRRLATALATPRWANPERIKAIYAEARRLTEETGVVMSVEHIIPLRGMLRKGEHVVCGLHCETNLMILPLIENKRRNSYAWIKDV